MTFSWEVALPERTRRERNYDGYYKERTTTKGKSDLKADRKDSLRLCGVQDGTLSF
jgi:hypothetical protein